MRGQGKLITGMIAGAGAMYLLDPDRGARRRSLLRDQGVHLTHKLGDGLAATARDTRNRSAGVAAELRGRFRREDPGDEVLHDRVRAAIGRVVSHPGAVVVTVFQGRVTLTGHVLAEELDSLIQGVDRVRGVREVENQLEIHPTPDGVSALQGSGRPREQRPELLQKNWAPVTRLALGTVAGLLVVRGSRTRGVPGRLMRVVGLGLLTRAAGNIPARSFVGLGARTQKIEVEKTLRVRVPAQRVWELWSNFENFPQFMAHLREVRKVDEGRSHWVAVGPAGVPVEWDAVVTDWVPNQFIGWTSVQGSTVETSGQVRFRPVSDSETQIDVQLSYNPPAGAAGHALATVLGVDPKRALDEDLLRLKSLLEDEKTSTGEGSVRLEEIAAAGKSPRPRKRSPSTRNES
jgi:uncharacterized membrane protein